VSLVLQGVSALFLTLSLNHQRIYRSSGYKKEPKHTDGLTESTESENHSLLDGSHTEHEDYPTCLRNLIFSPQGFFVLLFICYIIAMGFELPDKESISKNADPTLVVFMTFFALQRLPVFVLVITIIVNREKHPEAPSISSRVLLSIAAMFDLVNSFPLTVWSITICPRDPCDCVFVVGSWVDIIHLLYLISNLFFFLFIRAEYKRNKEECQWWHISEQQDEYERPY